MEKKKADKTFKTLEDACLLDNFSDEQKKDLKTLLKNQQEFIIDEKNKIETEKSLFKVRGLTLP